MTLSYIKNVYKKNSDSLFLYSSIGFDGSKARNNYYFTPDLSIARSICNTDELVGNWKVVFEGTKYSDLEFKVIKKNIILYIIKLLAIIFTKMKQFLTIIYSL